MTLFNNIIQFNNSFILRISAIHPASTPGTTELHPLSVGATERHLQSREIPKQHPETADRQTRRHHQGAGQGQSRSLHEIDLIF